MQAQNDYNAENSFAKIDSIIQLQRLGLPTPKTVFVFDAEKQEAEIDNFLKNREMVMIRSDKDGCAGKCPHNLKCPKNEAKEFIKKLNSEGFAAILQEHVPFNAYASGNIMLLKNKMIIEMTEGSPLTKLNRGESLTSIWCWGGSTAGRKFITTMEKGCLPGTFSKKSLTGGISAA